MFGVLIGSDLELGMVPDDQLMVTMLGLASWIRPTPSYAYAISLVKFVKKMNFFFLMFFGQVNINLK